MKRYILILALAVGISCTSQQPAVDPDLARWEQRAQAVTITRDDWGIPHIAGKSDADAVFGMIYAQAEDDFNRVETNYINAMGRLAETEGESQIYRDLRMKLFVNPEEMKALYETCPDWLKKLMAAFADGLNYYLYKHPEVKPRVITRFEPWMALTFSEGSISGNIARVGLRELEAFYGDDRRITAPADDERLLVEPTGSNSIAIAPSNTIAEHALLLINPHTSLFFRAELQMKSNEGLNAYGAVTWGQFFIYQGFNERTGWMHTTSGADNIDEYLETVLTKNDGLYYKYGDEDRPIKTTRITVPYRTDAGMAEKTFAAYRTHHGPIVSEKDGKWVSVGLMEQPVKALIQSFNRTKATSYRQFRETMELHSNSSNNTTYADADGNIAYFHANFIPRRGTQFDWTKPVDGSDPATEWNGVLSIDETPSLLNPPGGWLYNANDAPWWAAGPDSPKKENFPVYVETGGESPRGLQAVRLLEGRKDFTLDSLITAAYDSYLTAFEKLVPALVKAWDRTPTSSPLKAKLSEQIEILRTWDFRWSETSIPTTLAMFWAEEILRQVGADARPPDVPVYDYIMNEASTTELLEALITSSTKLSADFETWRTPWGEINRFQRLTGDVVQPFDDGAPSIPVGFTRGLWGSLAAFGARAYEGTKRWYGTSGNSFVAVVEFGETVRAKAISAGGINGDPASPHFNDQAMRYAKGELREVYFYPAQLEGHTERQYHPGR